MPYCCCLKEDSSLEQYIGRSASNARLGYTVVGQRRGELEKNPVNLSNLFPCAITQGLQKSFECQGRG